MNQLGKNAWAYAWFTAPALLVFALFFLTPMGMALRYGFTSWNGVSAPVYNGLANFRMAFGDPYFWIAVRNNLLFILFAVGLQIPLILILALFVSRVRRWMSLYQTLIFTPTILSTAVIGVLWGFIYHPQAGMLNHVWEAVGLPSWKRVWLGNEATAMPAVLIANAWQWIGFYVILVTASIRAIPRPVLEAAELDGAGNWRQAWHMIVPLLRPVLVVMVLLSVTGGMKALDIVVVMTGGNPYGITEVMGSYMLKKAYRLGEYGYASSIAILILLFTGVLTAAFGQLVRRREEVDW
ncbi:carbohydrate ABC transporter permease [Paenibacillus ferrarius]|uniref:carbohydrate ABC transporter permease n=1 Tax=Paenibacillus ferrarius TaxID=1469647 RepID=UPI003D2B4F37